MGINSTEVSYAFGQLGSAYCNTATAVAPPTGKVIVAIYFIQDNTPSVLKAEDSGMYPNTDHAAHASGEADEGSGGLIMAGGTKFKGGSTIFGRFTSVTPQADTDGGIICYFGN